ncbi:hypothetical protein ANOM_000993 [Aspergillus nomiae NRRL 13137]|uniref:Uncharacterized protein n=1 Tax=Aspergillus nomiae NRRL (strain ATCC 15546 / NRRL 13137 / CBS 260.88 / M93) TaxID=1509407 RepID=A0A0L1JGJ3_ASPN3|nr:uncharacterized protein ANOM_000993 [Aspergillus nomiae NRRL 13137]KNG90881.1 hypothetical protein ANOM_000993 [Aspergillus nomiae NRRL 13137]
MAQIYRQLLHWTNCHFHPEADHNVDINEGEVNRSKVIDHYLNSVALRPTSRRESKKQWSLALDESGDMPNSAEQLLDDYALALNIASPNTVAMRCRIDAVLLSILATAKKEETNAREHTAPDAEDSLYLAFLPKVSMPHTIKGKRYTLECNADNILWYGDRDELDTNLLVVRKESPLDTGDYSTLAPMVMIHRAHRLAGRKTEIYGICTDSCEWNFIHINKKGRVREPHALYKAHVHVFRSPIYHCTGCMTSSKLSNRFAASSAKQLPFIAKQVGVQVT